VSAAAHPLDEAGIRARRSPYQGLVPYSEEDADWFFGRDDWREIVIDNLRAYRVCVLYGASGVGKSSLLHAGVVHRLREAARRNLAESGFPELVVPFASWSTADPVRALMDAIRDSVDQVAPELARDAPTGPLADVLSAWGERIGGTPLVILDQFEEYFAYHPRDQGPDSFAEQLSRALRRLGTPGNFLISIREDALARLDRFQNRVPGLLDNLLRIEHLSQKAAQEAIERPLECWNEQVAEPGEEVGIERALVEAVLTQVAAGKVVVGEPGRAVVGASNGEPRIEAPYLQLVLSHLWAEEERVGSRVLRLATLERLGGADRIVRTHLDATMVRLPRREQDVAARALRYLVTPSGTKIALRSHDLAEFAEAPSEQLAPVLAVLAGEARILRPVRNETYEIYHDALAGPILDWTARWQERQRRRRERRRIGVFASAATFLAVVAGAFVVLMLQAQHARDVARSRELATTATTQLESDPQDSLRLALRALTAEPTEEAEDVLRAALAEANIRAVLRGHTGPVAGAAFSPDGRSAVTAGDDGTARVWNTESGASLHVLRGHSGRVLSASYSPDGKLVVTAGADGTARVWDAGNGASLRILYDHEGRVFSAVFDRDGRRIVTAGEDETARVWDTRSGKQLRVLRGHAGFVRTAAFSPDGRLVVTAGDDGTARVWDSRAGVRLAVLRGHKGIVYGAAFSPDGKLVVTAGADATARIWDVTGGAAIHVLRGHEAALNIAAFSHDGKLVITASDDGTARVWDARKGAGLYVLRGHGAVVNSAAFSPDGTLVVTAGADGTARVWDARSGAALHVLRGHGAVVNSAAFSRDGTLVVTASDDETARVWDGRRGASDVLRGRVGFGSAAFSPDGKLVVTPSPGGASIWNVGTGTRLRVLRGHKGNVYSAAFSPDGKLVVTASDDWTARVWDARSGVSLLVVRGPNGPFEAATFSPDGKVIATPGDDGTVRVWEAESGRSVLVLRAHKGIVYGAAFSPDGKLIVTAGVDARPDGTARVWDAESGRSLLVLRGHKGTVYGAAFSPDGKLIITAGADGTARVWDAESGTSLLVLRGHERGVNGATFSPDGKLVVTASADRTARVWDRRTGMRLATLRGHGDSVYSAAFSPDGRLIATTSYDGTARIYRCDVCGSIPELRARATEQLAHD
jgi:WD40 repeat protein